MLTQTKEELLIDIENKANWVSGKYYSKKYKKLTISVIEVNELKKILAKYEILKK